MATKPIQAAGATAEVYDAAYQRMLAARPDILRWFSPEAMADFDPDAPEVIGLRDDQITGAGGPAAP
jgi:hypothetical protein